MAFERYLCLHFTFSFFHSHFVCFWKQQFTLWYRNHESLSWKRERRPQNRLQYFIFYIKYKPIDLELMCYPTYIFILIINIAHTCQTLPQLTHWVSTPKIFWATVSRKILMPFLKLDINMYLFSSQTP